MILDFLKVRRPEWKEYYTHVLFIVIALIFVGRSIDFHFLTHLINGGDTQQWLNFKLFLEKGLYLWENTASGLILSMTFWVVPYNLVLFLLNIFIPNDILVVNIFWIGLLYLLQLSFFLFYRLFTRPMFAIFGVLLTILNIDFFILFHTPVALNLLAFLAFPLMYFLFHSYMIRDRFLFAFLYVLFQVILFRSLNILIIANLFVPLLFFIINIQKVKLNEFFKKTIIVWLVGLLLVSPFLVNAFFYYKNVNNVFLQEYNASSLNYQERFNLLNVYRLVPHYSFSDEFSEKPGLYFFDFSSTFLKSPYYVFVSLAPFLILISLLITTRKSRKGLILLTFLLCFIFLVKGVNPPGESLSEFLFRNQFFLNLFRSGAKYFLYFSMPLLILSIIYYLSLNKRRAYFIIPLIIYMISVGGLCLFAYKPIHKYWDTVLPASYTEFSSILENISGNGKYLVLPIAGQIAGYVDYKDGYSGPDRLYTLSSKPILTKMYTFNISSLYTKLMDDIKDNYQLVNDYPNILGYNYLILEKDTVYSPDHEVEEYSKIQDAINPNLWTKYYENDVFVLYQLKDDLFAGLISSTKSKVRFEEISSVEYSIDYNVRTGDVLRFQDSFDSNWKLYLQPISDSKATHKIVPSRLFSYLNTKPLFDNNYQKKDELGNSWNIDPDYIRRNYSNKYYKENSDGSIDVKLTLYFKPQTYFNLGLLISSLTILFSLGYLFCNNKRNNNLTLLNNEDI